MLCVLGVYGDDTDCVFMYGCKERAKEEANVCVFLSVCTFL